MMFSTNPFPQLTSAIQVLPPFSSFRDQAKDDLCITHPHRSNNSNNTNPFPSGDCFLAKENFTKHNLVEGLGLEQSDEYSHLFWSDVKKEKPSKKDHHSKIHTAKGPRDRRVRLSIEVAKKFFYLQDLLEVDKASKTLDWLFNKSKIAIDELIKRKKQSSSSTVTDRPEVLFLESGPDEQSKGRKKKCGEGKRKKITRNYKSRVSVNQSRAEARARARERTTEKLNIRKLVNESKCVQIDCCSSTLTLTSRFWNSVDSQNGYDDKIGESITDDRISVLYGNQHSLAVSNDLSSKFTGLPKFTDLHEPRFG